MGLCPASTREEAPPVVRRRPWSASADRCGRFRSGGRGSRRAGLSSSFALPPFCGGIPIPRREAVPVGGPLHGDRSGHRVSIERRGAVSTLALLRRQHGPIGHGVVGVGTYDPQRDAGRNRQRGHVRIKGEMKPRGQMCRANTGNLSSRISSTSRTAASTTAPATPLTRKRVLIRPPMRMTSGRPPPSTTRTSPGADCSSACSIAQVAPG